MRSRVTVLGHPVHQILVMFPIGMLGFGTVADVLARSSGTRAARLSWSGAARKSIAFGVAGAIAAAPFGLADYLAVPEGTRAKRIGRLHGIGNTLVLGLFGASLLARGKSGVTSRPAAALSLGGMLLASATAWLGTELVNRLGVGVYAPTDVDASSSLGESAIGRAALRAGKATRQRARGLAADGKRRVAEAR